MIFSFDNFIAIVERNYQNTTQHVRKSTLQELTTWPQVLWKIRQVWTGMKEVKVNSPEKQRSARHGPQSEGLLVRYQGSVSIMAVFGILLAVLYSSPNNYTSPGYRRLFSNARPGFWTQGKKMVTRDQAAHFALFSNWLKFNSIFLRSADDHPWILE